MHRTITQATAPSLQLTVRCCNGCLEVCGICSIGISNTDKWGIVLACVYDYFSIVVVSLFNNSTFPFFFFCCFSFWYILFHFISLQVFFFQFHCKHCSCGKHCKLNKVWVLNCRLLFKLLLLVLFCSFFFYIHHCFYCFYCFCIHIYFCVFILFIKADANRFSVQSFSVSHFSPVNALQITDLKI